MCQWVLVDLLVSTEIGYLLLTYAFYVYLRYFILFKKEND